ncbi:MAG: S41 family peptidase [Bacillota bacterium]|nr:S41 family peptidase [Bacillota bacterium]
MSQKTTKAVARVIAIVLAVALVVSTFAYVFAEEAFGAETGNAQEYLQQEFETLQDLILFLKENYKDEIDYETLMDGAFTGVMEALEDPYSVYYVSTAESEAFLESVSGQFEGIGVSLISDEGRCKVVTPLSNTPAEEAGIRSGDVITHVNDQNVESSSVEQISTMLRGPVGSSVKVTVERNGAPLVFTITRAVISTPSVSYEMLEGHIGYIAISEFDEDCHTEFTEAKLRLIADGARSFIVDIRNNPGGYVSGAAEIANQLMPKGDIVHFEQQGAILDSYQSTGLGDLGIPVVLLVNEGSASASEILAGAWQDSGTAVLVGVATYGKGVAQQVMTLDNDSAIKLSVYYFLTPDKHVIDGVGITPDYVVENYSVAEAESLAALYSSFAPMSETTKPASGDTGLNVYGAQQRLDMLGYSVEVSGVMDAATVSAVRQFQTDSALYSYGVLDYTTQAALESAAALMAAGTYAGEDLQLQKAIELLSE